MKVKPVIYLIAAIMMLMQGSYMAFGQPPGDREGERGVREGGPPPRGERGDRDRGPGGPGGPRRPRPWEPGKIMPPPVRHHLNLTKEQESQIETLEAEVKERLLKILTDEQKEDLKDLPPMMGPPPGGPRGGGDRDGRPPRRGPGGPEGGRGRGGPDGFRGGPDGPGERDGFRGPPRGPRGEDDEFRGPPRRRPEDRRDRDDRGEDRDEDRDEGDRA